MAERIGEMARFNSLYQVETSTHVVQLSEHLHQVECGVSSVGRLAKGSESGQALRGGHDNAARMPSG